MRRGRGAGLAGLAAVLLVAAGRAQVQQEPSAETTEGTGVTINCSHPNIQTGDVIHWYRQLPGRGPAFLVSSFQGSRELQAPPGRLSVAADRRSSALWLARPRRGDAAVYYCALGDTGRGAGAAAGHEPPRAGPGGAGGGGGTVPGVNETPCFHMNVIFLSSRNDEQTCLCLRKSHDNSRDDNVSESQNGQDLLHVTNPNSRSFS
ncbi:uncharacterized protein LOC141953267 [Strix uralensis]|uniref:uncharacterized protein LOC141953267 n=1 Tax=Strix uralensis TaxID=36305 RepID=UPI003DA6E311